MQIVIDIPKEKYDLCKKWKPSERSELQEAVANGTPLPKGHGGLIDVNQYKQTLVGYIDENKNSDDMFLAGCGDGAYHAMCMLKDIPTIIEADSKMKGEN